MSISFHATDHAALARMAEQAPRPVIEAIQSASARTGVDFAYLLRQAAAESSFNPEARAKTSTATGLYQFIESTWLSMVETHGHKHGLGDLAARVSDPAARQEILALRRDPGIAAGLAAEYAADNGRTLERLWGGDVGATELYLAHFLGAGGAAAFLQARDDSPAQKASVLFPKAAQANKGVFYDPQTGDPRSVEQIYRFFDQKFRPESVAGAPTMKGTPRPHVAPVFPKKIAESERFIKEYKIFSPVSEERTRAFAPNRPSSRFSDAQDISPHHPVLRAFFTSPALQSLAPELAALGWSIRAEGWRGQSWSG